MSWGLRQRNAEEQRGEPQDWYGVHFALQAQTQSAVTALVRQIDSIPATFAYHNSFDKTPLGQVMSEATRVNPYSSSYVIGESANLDRRLSFATIIAFTTMRLLGVAFLLALFRVYNREKLTWETALSVAIAVTVCFTVLHWIEYRCSHNRGVAFKIGIAAYAAGACSALLLHYWIVNY